MYSTTRKSSSTPTTHIVAQQQSHRAPSNPHTPNCSLPSLNGAQQTTPISYYNPPHFRATSPLFKASTNRAQTSHSPTRKLNADTNLFRDIYEIIVLSETYPDLFDRWSEKQKLFTAVIVNITNVFRYKTSLRHDFIEAGNLAFNHFQSNAQNLKLLLLGAPELQTLITTRPKLIQDALTSLDQFIHNELSAIQRKSYAIQSKQPTKPIRLAEPVELQAAPIELVASTELENKPPMSQERYNAISQWVKSTSIYVTNTRHILPPAVDEDLLNTFREISALKF